MHDAAAQKTYYGSRFTVECRGRREMWHGQRPQKSIERQVGGPAAWGWVIHPAGWDGAGRGFFKHLTEAECGVPCLRVIASRPPLCTGVITLHFTLPVILACCDSVFEQHGGSWSEWLNTMFLCMSEESQRVKSTRACNYMSFLRRQNFISWRQWALFLCWNKAGWFLPVLSRIRHLKYWPTPFVEMAHNGTHLSTLLACNSNHIKHTATAIHTDFSNEFIYFLMTTQYLSLNKF